MGISCKRVITDRYARDWSITRDCSLVDEHLEIGYVGCVCRAAEQLLHQARIQWPFPEHKLEVPTIYNAYVRAM